MGMKETCDAFEILLWNQVSVGFIACIKLYDLSGVLCSKAFLLRITVRSSRNNRWRMPVENLVHIICTMHLKGTYTKNI